MLPIQKIRETPLVNKGKRKMFNKWGNLLLNNFKKMVTLNIDDILPFKEENYNKTTGSLSATGFMTLWKQLR